MKFLYAVPLMTLFDVIIPDESLNAVDRETIELLQKSGDELALALWWRDNRERLKDVVTVTPWGVGSELPTDMMPPPWMIVTR